MRHATRARMPVRWLVLLLAIMVAVLLLSCARDSGSPSQEEAAAAGRTGPAGEDASAGQTGPSGEAASAAQAGPAPQTPSASDTTAICLAGWAPEGDYWKAYRTIFVIAACDSNGRVTETELLYNYALPAEADSARDLVSRMRFDPESYSGRIRFKDVHRYSRVLDRIRETMTVPPGGALFVVPVPTHGGRKPPPGLPSHGELERAALGPWFAICDSLRPDWPYGDWSVTAKTPPLHQRDPKWPEDDAALTEAGLVSRSPDGRWGIHPFYGTPIENGRRLDGRPVDGGFVLYRSGSPSDVRQHVVGPGTSFLSAHWIDSEQYLVTAISEEGVSMGGMWTGYHVPQLLIGHVDSTAVLVLTGPPFPLPEQGTVMPRFGEYQKKVYPITGR